MIRPCPHPFKIVTVSTPPGGNVGCTVRVAPVSAPPARTSTASSSPGVAMFRIRPHRIAAAAIGAGLLATLTLAACGGGGGSDASDAAGSGRSSARRASPRGSAPARVGTAPSSDGTPGKGAGPGTADPVTAANLAASQESLARRASIALQVKNIGQAVAKVRATTATAEGIVLSENIGTANGDTPLAESAKVTATTYGEITISVPRPSSTGSSPSSGRSARSSVRRAPARTSAGRSSTPPRASRPCGSASSGCAPSSTTPRTSTRSSPWRPS